MLADSLCQFPGKLCRQVIIAAQCCKPFIGNISFNQSCRGKLCGHQFNGPVLDRADIVKEIHLNAGGILVDAPAPAR